MAIKTIKDIKLLLALLMSVAIAGACKDATDFSTITTSYQSNHEDFSNPERGFYFPLLTNNQDSDLQLSTLEYARSKSITLIRRVYVVPQFRHTKLSNSFLDFVTKDCETARKSGVKLIVRFAYNWKWRGHDAPINRILSHLDQLQPIFEANQDVIAYMEAGFMGSWGEWHNSSNSLDNTQDRRKILFKILSVLPPERMVALRYPHHKTDIYNNNNPLTPQEAFNGTYRARTGAHNDCFVSAAHDMNTYHWTDPASREKTKNFLNLDNRYVVQGGETCAPSPYDDCPNALKELGRMRWSNLNSEFEKTVLQGWETQGCIGQIKRRLGYRFRLLNSTSSKIVKPAGTFSMNIKIVNDGWASPYNRRNLEVILRNRRTGKEYFLPVNEDPRMWMPGATKVVNIIGGIPVTMPQGEYQVLLNLPDPATRLYNRPEYSIRFANQNVWEASTGYNSLLQSVTVASNAAGSKYSGNQFFRSR